MIRDRILVRRFNRGDPAVLCRIYEKYRDDLLKVAAALLHERSDIEDVSHDVFVDFAQATGRFRLRSSLKGYLSICVANGTRDLIARDQHRATVTHRGGNGGNDAYYSLAQFQWTRWGQNG